MSLIIIFSLIFISYLLGHFGYRVLKFEELSLSNEGIFKKTVAGLSIIITTFAIIMSRGETIFIIYPIVLLIFYSLDRKNKRYFQQSTDLINTKEVIRLMYLLIPLFLIWVFFYCKIYNFNTGNFKEVWGDAYYYALLVENLSEKGTERFLFFISDKLIPYHFGELWLAAISTRFFNIPGILSIYLVAFPITLWIAFVAASTYVEHRFKQWNFKITIISILFFVSGGLSFSFISEILPKIGDNIYYLNILSFDKFYKGFFVNAAILWIFLSVERKEIKELKYALLFITIMHTTSSIALLISTVVFAFYWILIKKWQPKEILVQLLLPLVLIGVSVLLFYYLINMNRIPIIGLDKETIVNYYTSADAYKLMANVFVGTTLKTCISFLFIIPILIYLSDIRKMYLNDKVVFVIIVAFTSLGIYTLVNFLEVNLVQIWSGVFVPLYQSVVFILFIVLLSSSYTNVTIKIYSGIIIFVLIFVSIQLVKTNVSRTFISKQEYDDLNKIRKENENGWGVVPFFLSQQSMNNAYTKNLNTTELTNFLSYEGGTYVPVCMTSYSVHSDKNSFWQHQEKVNIENAVFNKYIKEYGSDKDSIEDIQLRFIHTYKSRYLAIEKNSELKPKILALIGDTLFTKDNYYFVEVK